MMDPSTLKLPQRLALEPDRKIIKSFREWEKYEKLSATFRNHLHYTLHCKHHGVTPPSLKLKSAMKGRNADLILQRAQRALTNERINDIKRRLQHFKSESAGSDEFLFSVLPSDVYSEIKQFMTHAYTRKYTEVKVRQQNKFTRLLAKTEADKFRKNGPITHVSPEEAERIKSKWVVNLSNKQLTDDETDVLRKGLNYAVTPAQLFTG